MIKRVAFTMYPVKNIERARDFYENKLGIKVGKISGEGKWVEYDLPGGGCFAITTYAEGVEPSANAGGSIAFEVEDFEKMVDKLKADGVKFKFDPFETPVCKFAVAIDSEGNSFMLHKLHKEIH